MSNYTQVNDYSAKDALSTGDPNKKIKGSDVDAEFAAITTAITSKADSASPTLTGTVTITGATVAGAATVSGGNTHSGDNTFSGNNTWTGQNVGLFSTGDVKLTLKASADSGWVLMNDGSIGSAASGATTRANADTSALFSLLWTNIVDAWAPVSGGRGASATADFAANKTLTLPRVLGRALAGAGAGSGLTSRALGAYLGTETHTLVSGEMPAHTHNIGTNSSGLNGSSGGDQATKSAGNGNVDITSGSAGGGGAHNNMQPSAFFNVMVKL